ncbi:MAG: class I SAM-dependent methyltransferase [Phycisphaerae bacterium]|jgi:SAM-dependent methyltransferase
MNSEISKEIKQHGPNWDKLHNGYFSDPAIAACLIKKIKSAIAISKPEVLIDLGGGTGFILSELIKNNIPSAIRLVNIDLSGKQVENLKDSRIKIACGCISDSKRSDADNESKQFLFIMRSALHYFGEAGLMPILQHLRSQTKTGEFFIHQTACFKNERDAECLNDIYKLMGTGKWYPTVNHLSNVLENTGWAIKSVSPAPKLQLASDDLIKRYGLSKKIVSQIHSEIIKRYGQIEDVISTTSNGFCAYLHYKIYTCAAV